MIPDDERHEDKNKGDKKVTKGDLVGIAKTTLYSLRHAPGL